MNFNPPPSPPITTTPIQGDYFFPALDLETFCAQYRIPCELPRSMVENALIRAYGNVVQQLNSFTLGAKKLGFLKLANVDSIKVNNHSLLELEFIRAVSCFAKAELLRETPSMIRLKAAENSAKTADETESFYHELAHIALAKILGVSGRINVETL